MKKIIVNVEVRAGIVIRVTSNADIFLNVIDFDTEDEWALIDEQNAIEENLILGTLKTVYG